MRLFYRTTDKVVEQQSRIDELVKKDNDHKERLNDMEQKFKDVKASVEALVAELQKTLQSAK